MREALEAVAHLLQRQRDAAIPGSAGCARRRLLALVATIFATSRCQFLGAALVLLDTTSVGIEVGEIDTGAGIASVAGVLIHLRGSSKVSGNDARLSAAAFEHLGDDTARMHVVQIARSLIEPECLRFVPRKKYSSEQLGSERDARVSVAHVAPQLKVSRSSRSVLPVREISVTDGTTVGTGGASDVGPGCLRLTAIVLPQRRRSRQPNRRGE